MNNVRQVIKEKQRSLRFDVIAVEILDISPQFFNNKMTKDKFKAEEKVKLVKRLDTPMSELFPDDPPTETQS